MSGGREGAIDGGEKSTAAEGKRRGSWWDSGRKGGPSIVLTCAQHIHMYIKAAAAWAVVMPTSCKHKLLL